MLSVSQAADMLQVTPQRVRALIAQNALPAQKVGRTWVLNEEDVARRAQKRQVNKQDIAEAASADTVELLHQVYALCAERFSHAPSNALLTTPPAEESAFAVAVFEFFLQQRQHELVEQGCF